MSSATNPSTLAEILSNAPSEKVAVILPESGIRVTYGSLRDQVMSLADALASAGIQSGDRVSTVLPNGLPCIVSFLAASIAGTSGRRWRIRVIVRLSLKLLSGRYTPPRSFCFPRTALPRLVKLRRAKSRCTH